MRDATGSELDIAVEEEHSQASRLGIQLSRGRRVYRTLATTSNAPGTLHVSGVLPHRHRQTKSNRFNNLDLEHSGRRTKPGSEPALMLTITWPRALLSLISLDPKSKAIFCATVTLARDPLPSVRDHRASVNAIHSART